MDHFPDGAAIRRELRLEALQHPATILPAALCVLAAIYLVFCSAILGGALVAAILLTLSGMVTTICFFWRHALLYQGTYRQRINEILVQQRRARQAKEQAELEHLVELAQDGFSEVDSTRGLRALRGLVCEHAQLQRALDHGRHAEQPSLAHLFALTEATYRQGIGVLVDALETERVIVSSDRERLEAEIATYKQEIECLEANGGAASLAEIKRATIASHRERLELVREQSLRAGKLLFQCDRCEASLHRTRIELAALKTENAETSISAVTERLQRTIEQAKEVQEELRALGF